MKIQLLSLAFGLLSSIGFAQNDITLEDLWINYSYQPDYVRGFNSMNDGLHYTILNNKAIEKMDYATQKKVGEMASFEDLGIQYSSYHFNANESQILLTSERKSIYRHSYEANFYVYDLANKQLEELAEGKQMLATFSPNNQHIAYVFENNLYIKDQNTKTIAQITTDGKKNEIINGAPDWVYEEEFGFNKAFEWNADGSKLAYYKFDESEVEVFGMDMFQQHLYPQSYRFKYPKAGEKNATVELWIYDLETNRSTKIEQNIDTEFYIPRLKWTKNPAVLSFQRLNRHQNQLDFILYDCETKTSRTLFVETDEAYVDIHDDLTFLDNGKHLIWSSEKSGYKHIYLVDLKSSKEKQITSGNWEVTQFYGYNEGDKKLYFQSNEHSPLQRSIYSIGLNGKGKKELTKTKGTHNAQFSSSFDYFVDTYSSANTPDVVSIRTKTGKEIKILAKSDRLNAKLDKLNLKPKEFISFETETGTKLNGYLIKPKDFDANKTYPVFMYLYGGPGSQQVLDSWGGSNYIWFQMLANQGYIVACFDNRGTGGRGRDFKKSTYLELGKLETEDQIAANRYLASLNYVDGKRIGIFGWSYGGFMSSNCLFQAPDYFKMAIAVAPVTNWRYYDSIYTERYMRTPKENADGYDKNSPISHVSKLKGNYLLIHGTADDNVHFQNTTELISALISENKTFDTEIYPDKNHSIYGGNKGNTRLHLYNKMTAFIHQNL